MYIRTYIHIYMSHTHTMHTHIQTYVYLLAGVWFLLSQQNIQEAEVLCDILTAKEGGAELGGPGWPACEERGQHLPCLQHHDGLVALEHLRSLHFLVLELFQLALEELKRFLSTVLCLVLCRKSVIIITQYTKYRI